MQSCPMLWRRSFEREKEVVIERALRDAWTKLNPTPDTVLTREHLLKLSGLLVEGMMPFIRHHAPHHRGAQREFLFTRRAIRQDLLERQRPPWRIG